MGTSIHINRSPSVVWDYFTEPKQWGKWWYASFNRAQWRKGGKHKREMRESTVEFIVPERGVQIRGSHMRTKRLFAAREIDSVMGTENWVQFEPAGGASFSDGGAAHLKNLEESLARLKNCIEQGVCSTPSSPNKEWWEFWK